ncbi:replication protein [Salmonella enterica]|nr:replication protein [Salmonella enterica]ECP4188708.1 replication protein [Salmonella enterica]
MQKHLPPPQAAGPVTEHRISYNIQNNGHKKPQSVPVFSFSVPPTTEKRSRPGPKARNNVAFNAG